MPRIRIFGIFIEYSLDLMERIFSKKETPISVKIDNLNKEIHAKYKITIFDIAEKPFPIIESNLNKIDKFFLEEIIELIFQISVSRNKSKLLLRLKSNPTLNQRIIDLINYYEKRETSLSSKLSNIKNSTTHMLKFSHITDAANSHPNLSKKV